MEVAKGKDAGLLGGTFLGRGKGQTLVDRLGSEVPSMEIGERDAWM